jgi:hypothetical protein
VKTLAALSYDELLARAAAVGDLPQLRVDVSPLTEGGKHYWTKDPEGLAKWASHPDPYTALYNHIIKWKGMTPHYAHKIAGAWYFEVFGHGPTAGKHKHGNAESHRSTAQTTPTDSAWWHRKFDPHQKRDESGKWSNFNSLWSKALSGAAALATVPAKLHRAPGGHHGDYEGASIDGPSGMGSVDALSKYQGLEYQRVNLFLRGEWRGQPGPGKLPPDKDPDDEFYRESIEIAAELDKTMAVSKLQADVRVDRVVKSGKQTFGEKAWYGGVIDWELDDFDEQDRQIETWEAGARPDLTGMRFVDHSFQSTTADPAAAVHHGRRWPGTNSKLDGEPIIMTILAPKGTGAVQLSEMGHEAEILLDRGLTMEVVADHGVDGDGFRRLDVRVVTGD